MYAGTYLYKGKYIPVVLKVINPACGLKMSNMKECWLQDPWFEVVAHFYRIRVGGWGFGARG